METELAIIEIFKEAFKDKPQRICEDIELTIYSKHSDYINSIVLVHSEEFQVICWMWYTTIKRVRYSINDPSSIINAIEIIRNHIG